MLPDSLGPSSSDLFSPASMGVNLSVGYDLMFLCGCLLRFRGQAIVVG